MVEDPPVAAEPPLVESPLIGELMRDYRLTYGEYARRAEALEQVGHSGHPDSNAVEDAVLALEKARVAWTDARDRLAERLSGVSPSVNPAFESSENDSRVRETAHILWEFSGRPSGTAERDWNRARQLVMAAGQSH